MNPDHNIQNWRRFLSGRSSSHEPVGKRVLLVWDFQVVPYSLGELLYLHMRAAILQWLHKAEKVDIAFVCDPAAPARKDQRLTSRSYQSNLMALLPVALMNPALGNFYLFDSNSQLEAHLSKNLMVYSEIWPSAEAYSSRQPAYTDNFAFIEAFFQQHGWTPQLACHPGLQDWARSFLLEAVLPEVAVAVHLRNNLRLEHSLGRNSRIDCWIEFFRHCYGKFPVKFVVICARSEINPQLRECPNVVLAKDHQTSVEQDLALIQACGLFMGGASGPALMAVFGSLPYLIFNVRTVHETRPPNTQHIFASAQQKLVWQPETTDLLIREFTALYKNLNPEQWLDAQAERLLLAPPETHSHFALR
jgi:hypothetical protein